MPHIRPAEDLAASLTAMHVKNPVMPLLMHTTRLILLAALCLAIAGCNQASDKEIESSLFRVIALRQGADGTVIGRGTAFKVGANGTVVTNHHVIQNASRIILAYWSNGRLEEAEARVEHADANVDLALLRAVKPLPGEALPIAQYTPANGSEAWALGFPGAADALFGRARTFEEFFYKLAADASMSVPTRTYGVISSERQRNRVTYLQHQVPINPGNSGGPLIDACGAVIGINTLAVTNANAIFGAVSSRELIDLMRMRTIEANVATSRCWTMFEPRYLPYSLSIIAAVVAAFAVLAIAIFLLVRYAGRRRSGSTTYRRKSGSVPQPQSTSGKVIDITPIPLDILPRPETPAPARNGARTAATTAAAPSAAAISARLVPASGGPPIDLSPRQLPMSFVIGRGSDCAIVLDDPTISRAHSRIDFGASGQISVADLGSFNGTRINGAKIATGRAGAGDRLSFGSLEFLLETGPQAGDPHRPQRAGAGSASWLLAGSDERGETMRFVIESGEPARTWIMGRDGQTADLVVASPTVSGKHAELRSAADGRLEIRDLGSANGTLLNGKRVGKDWMSIDTASQVRLGACEIKATRR